MWWCGAQNEMPFFVGSVRCAGRGSGDCGVPAAGLAVSAAPPRLASTRLGTHPPTDPRRRRPTRGTASPHVAGDGRDDPGLAGQPSGFGGGDPVPGVDGGDPDPGHQRVDAEGDHQGERGPVHARQIGEVVLDQLHQPLPEQGRVRQLLPGLRVEPAVADPARAGECLQRLLQQVGVQGGQLERARWRCRRRGRGPRSAPTPAPWPPPSPASCLRRRRRPRGRPPRTTASRAA